MQNIENVVHFNSAYYGAVAGVERWYLVLKYKQPGFEWSGWFLQWESFGPASDFLDWGLGLLTNDNNWVVRNINSRTRSIPNPSEWNIEPLFSSGTDSIDYNKLSYYLSEKINLSIDNTTNSQNYYNDNSQIDYFSAWNFDWIIRLSPAIVSKFQWDLLCDNCDHNWDWIANDIMVNRTMNGMNNWKYFSIIPTISIFYYSWWVVNEYEDNAIREKILNETWFLWFGNQWDYSPLTHPNTLESHNIISSDDSIKNQKFSQILNWNFTWISLEFGIVNMLRTQDDKIYPFLEYQFKFPEEIADNFYNIQGIGQVWDYNVKIFIKKSTNEQQGSFGDFTIIF